MKALETTVEGLQTDLGKANQKIAQLNEEAVKGEQGCRRAQQKS